VNVEAVAGDVDREGQHGADRDEQKTDSDTHDGDVLLGSRRVARRTTAFRKEEIRARTSRPVSTVSFASWRDGPCHSG
jgi:hypothetical protein